MTSVLDLIGNPGETAAEIARFSADARSFSRNYDRFTRVYPGEFVAVKDKKEVGHKNSLSELVEDLLGLGIDAGKTYIRYVYREGNFPILVLWN